MCEKQSGLKSKLDNSSPLVVKGWLLSSLTNGIGENTSELEELTEEVVDDSMKGELGDIGEAGSETELGGSTGTKTGAEAADWVVKSETAASVGKDWGEACGEQIGLVAGWEETEGATVVCSEIVGG